MKRVTGLCLVLFVLPALAACGGGSSTKQYAVYGEYARDSNKLMKAGLNRRVFNKVESQAGSDIHLNSDGSVTLQPGTYHITGYSITSTQTTFAPPVAKHDSNYPGYALVYPTAYETSGQELLEHTLAIGSPQNALDTTPSTFDFFYKTDKKTDIAVGHQSGADLHDEVYLSVYEVAGTPSDYHVFARISITKL